MADIDPTSNPTDTDAASRPSPQSCNEELLNRCTRCLRLRGPNERRTDQPFGCTDLPRTPHVREDDSDRAAA